MDLNPVWSGVPAAIVNTGAGPHFDVLDVGHPDYVVLIEADTAFWLLAPRHQALDLLLGAELTKEYQEKQSRLATDLHNVRFGLLPSAVYFNPTQRCNLDCAYCYLPRKERRRGVDMSPTRLLEALERLADFFYDLLPPGAKPQMIFHGSEPMLAREAVFAGMERYQDRFRFGIQTNATLLDGEAISFLRSHQAGIGISLDAATAELADRTRRTWAGSGVFRQTVAVLEKLADYPGLTVIATLTRENVRGLSELVEFLHGYGVGNALLNPVRGTQPGGRALLPDPAELAAFFFQALKRCHELFQKTGHRLVIGNFANLLLGLVAPGARRLMCDISPCGGGRCFFAVGADGVVAPCSEFLGLSDFSAGNLFDTPVSDLLASEPFKEVTARWVEKIDPCRRCVVRHFCGAPCPAEVYAMSGNLLTPAPLCDFYAAQARFAFRVIADGHLDDYLWENWQEGLERII